MARYAQGTTVGTGASRDEIERILMRYGATSFGYGIEDEDGVARSAISFVAHGRRIRMIMMMPSRDDREFTHTPSKGTARSADAALKAWETACRQKWRALTLLVKALLEGVESEIVTFEEAFLPYTLVPGTNETVAERIGPEVTRAVESGGPPRFALMKGSS